MVGIGNFFKRSIPDIVKEITGVIDEVTTTKEEKAAINERITTIVQQHVERMATLANESEKQLLQDLDSARKMNSESAKSDDKFVRRFIYYLAGFIVLAVFAMLTVLMLGNVPDNYKDIALVVLGMTGGALTQVLAFFFGSTRGSDHKNETIKNLTRNGSTTG